MPGFGGRAAGRDSGSGSRNSPAARAIMPLMERRYGHDHDSGAEQWAVRICPPSAASSKTPGQGIFRRVGRAMGKLYQSVADGRDDPDSRRKSSDVAKKG